MTTAARFSILGCIASSAAALLAAGCIGVIGDEDGAGEDGADAPPGGALAMGGYHMMRLTSAEYDHTVHDLLGDTTRPASAFSPDEKVGPFDANVLAPPSEVMLEAYMHAAESLAAKGIEDIAALTGCGDTLGTDACADAFIEGFGARAYRRPLAPDQAARLRTAYDAGKTIDGFAHGIELVVRAALQSPFFLYRVEVGAPVADAPGIAKLDGWEIASRLSYFLWDSMPDGELFAAAERGDLATPDGIEAHARRMLASPKAEPMISTFHVQWMGLGVTLQKDVEAFPEFDDALIQSMRAETGLFATDVISSGDGTLSALLTASYTFADAPLAAIYGVDRGDADPDELVRVELDPAERGGLLTRLGVLSATSHIDRTSVVLRGRFLRTVVLCSPLPPPPADVDVSNVGADRTKPPCNACHDLMDPLGRGLEQYDAIGRFFDDADSDGKIVGTDVDAPFQGGAELSARLAESAQVRDCVARQWFRFALGRPENAELDERSLDAIDAAFEGGDLRELIVSLTLTDAFRFRPLEEP
jgi:hypothetical protein